MVVLVYSMCHVINDTCSGIIFLLRNILMYNLGVYEVYLTFFIPDRIFFLYGYFIR